MTPEEILKEKIRLCTAGLLVQCIEGKPRHDFVHQNIKDLVEDERAQAASEARDKAVEEERARCLKIINKLFGDPGWDDSNYALLLKLREKIQVPYREVVYLEPPKGAGE